MAIADRDWAKRQTEAERKADVSGFDPQDWRLTDDGYGFEFEPSDRPEGQSGFSLFGFLVWLVILVLVELASRGG